MFRPCIRCERNDWQSWDNTWCLMSSLGLITPSSDISVWAPQLLGAGFTLLFAHSSVSLKNDHLQVTFREQRQFFPCITNLSNWCLWSYLSPMAFHFWLPSCSRVWLARPVSVTSVLTPHTHSPWGKGIRLCLSSHSSSCCCAPSDLGDSLSHTAVCILELLWTAPAADKLGGVEQMGWTLFLERTFPPYHGTLPDIAVHGSQSSLSQTITLGLCSQVLLTLNSYTAKMLSTPSWLLPKRWLIQVSVNTTDMLLADCICCHLRR